MNFKRNLFKSSWTPELTIIPILILLFSSSLFSQSKSEIYNEWGYKNAIVLEAGGHGFAYSVNIEHIFFERPNWKTIGQIGASWYPNTSGVIPLWVPMSLNQLFKTAKNQYLEIGVGKLLINDRLYVTEKIFQNNFHFQNWIFRLGYRLEPIDSRWIFKAGYTPLYFDKELIHWGAFAVGFRI